MPVTLPFVVRPTCPRGQPGGHHLKHRIPQSLRDLLRQPRHADVSAASYLTGVGADLVVDERHQGGLTDPVAADQADPFSPVDLKIGPIE